MEMEVWLMNGLVLEGGTFRPIFSSGVMDALLTEDIMLPYWGILYIETKGKKS